MKFYQVLILCLIFMAIGAACTYYFYPRVQVEYQIQETKVDSTEIVQKARMGYVLLSEYQDLVNSQPAAQTFDQYIEKIRWKDSLRIKDSTVVTYIPYYYADTTLNFQKQDLDKGYDFSMELGLRNRFYPLTESFQTMATVNKLEIRVVYQKPWEFDTSSGLLGFGAGIITAGGIAWATRQQ